VKQKSLIITADDFGLWPEVNDAVFAGYDAGILTSAGLRVGAPAAKTAMVSAAMRPDLGVGLHLVLCGGTATLPSRDIPNLVDSSGRFVERPLEAIWLYRRGGGLREELKAEIRAQIERFLASGLFLTHISSVYHLHLHPTVLAIIRELACEYPISAIRKPCGGLWRFSRHRALPGWQRRSEAIVVRPMLAWGRLRARAFAGPDRVEPLNRVRPCTEYGLAARLREVGPGTTELICHPGSLLGRFDGVGEAAAVTSSTVRDALACSDLEMISYRDLAEGMG